MAGSLQNLGNAMRLRGDLSGAEATLHSSMATYARVMGVEHADVQLVRLDLAIVRLQGGDETGATELAARVLRARGEAVWDPRVQGVAASSPGGAPDAVFGARTRSDFGACLTTLGRFAEAEPQLRDSCAVLRRELGDDHRLTRETRRRVDALRKAWSAAGR